MADLLCLHALLFENFVFLLRVSINYICSIDDLYSYSSRGSVNLIYSHVGNGPAGTIQPLNIVRSWFRILLQ